MHTSDEEYTRPGYFSEIAAADSRRKEFDIKNHSLIYTCQKPDFLFIGDSITHYWELNAYFNRPGQLIVNRGIGGDTTGYLRKRFYADALQLHPKYCIMGIGINDSIELEGDYWKRIEPKPYEEVLTAAQRNIMDIIRQAEHSDTMLILASLLPIHIPVSLNEAVRRKYIKEMNEWLEQTAKKEKLIFVNYYVTTIFPGTEKPPDGITYDGLHPNAKGYEIMAEALKNTLRQYQIYL